jgi:predicted lactoylglutathione lyase
VLSKNQNAIMTTKVFINLPVKDLAASMEFYSKLGFQNNPQFTDQTAACMVFSENLYVMLLTYEKFRNFTKKEIGDASQTTQMLLAVSVETKDKVKELINLAVKSGGSIYMDAAEYEWMYQHSFADPDGHQWEVFYMDESKLPKT